MRYTRIIKSVGYRNKKSKQKIRAFHQLMQKPDILTSAECFISMFFLNKFRLWKVSIEMNWQKRVTSFPGRAQAGCAQRNGAQPTSGHTWAPACLRPNPWKSLWWS